MEDLIKVCIEVSQNADYFKVCFEATADTIMNLAEQYTPVIEEKLKELK